MRRNQARQSGVLHRLARHRLAVAGAVVFAALVTVAALADVIAPFPFDRGDYGAVLQGPSATHWLGTDEHGRDVFSRLVYGTRLSLAVGVIAVGLGLIGGVAFGAAAGYYGGWTDLAIMRCMDVMLALPATLLAIAIMVMLGPGLTKAMIAIGLVSIPAYARLVRGAVLAVRQSEYVEAARALGVSEWRQVTLHILPNIMAPVLVRATLGTSEAILEAAALGFLGLGAQLPLPEWGTMLSRGHAYFHNAPHLVLFPGLAITLAVLSLNLFGDGLRDALDPRLRL